MDCIPPCFHGIATRIFACTVDWIATLIPGPNPNSYFYMGNEYLAVANPASVTSAPERIDRLIHHIVAEHDFDFHLREKIDDVFGAAV